jgi:phosphate transport system substrate-binding protein
MGSVRTVGTWMAVATLAFASTLIQAQVKGAGSTFAANLYGTWTRALPQGQDARMDYDPIGSGGGIAALQNKQVDFAGSDRPMQRAALEQHGFVQFPTAVGGVVIITNLPGVDGARVKLDAQALAEIYLGKLTQWSDPALTRLNPELALPRMPIVPVHRSDSSGTSFVFTSYLSKVHGEFKSAVGVTSTLKVAEGKSGKTSGEVLKLLQATPGAIAYLDYANAHELQLPSAQLKNAWGKFVASTPEAMQLAMRAADWEMMMIDQEPTFEMDLTNAGCPGCWPIAAATYVLVPLRGRNANSYRVLDFFENAIGGGDDMAAKEGYVPLPSKAKSMVLTSMRRWHQTLERSGAGRPVRRSEDTMPTATALALAPSASN